MRVLVLAIFALLLSHEANAQYGQLVDVERTILCESFGASTQCHVGLDRIYGMRIREISYGACREGATYALNHGVIRVRNNCRAYFIIRGATAYPQYNDTIIGGGGYGPLVTRRVVCESFGTYDTQHCRIPLRKFHDGYLEREYSYGVCRDGQTFRFMDGYIQVSRGCRASFVVRGYE
jgi:hypothetical protein